MTEKSPCKDLLRLESTRKEDSAKLDMILNTLNEIQVQVAVNNQSLKEHMRRTALLEAIVNEHEKRSYTLSTRLYVLVGTVSVIQAIVLFLVTKMQ